MSDKDEDNFLQNLLNAVGDESYRLTGMTKINYTKLRRIFGWLTTLSFIALAVSITLGYGINSVLTINVIKFAKDVVMYSTPIFAVLFLIYLFLVKKSNYYNNAYNYVTDKIDELNLYGIDGQSKVLICMELTDRARFLKQFSTILSMQNLSANLKQVLLF